MFVLVESYPPAHSLSSAPLSSIQNDMSITPTSRRFPSYAQSPQPLHLRSSDSTLLSNPPTNLPQSPRTAKYFRHELSNPSVLGYYCNPGPWITHV